MFTRNYWHGILASASFSWADKNLLQTMDGTWVEQSLYINTSSDYYNELTAQLLIYNYGYIYLGRGSYFSINSINNGTTIYYLTSSGTMSTTTDSGTVPYQGVILGDGNTIPTINDYKLSGNRITTFSATTSLISSCVGGEILLEAIYHVTNTGSSTFTVRELGIMSPYEYSQGTFLMEHSLLETPVTINPGETKSIAYKIKLT